ncbi:MAG: hypothetical protein HY231_13780 [Acidobacteria bacterium]|nr:hypothetical protein [Acidobacteriota bacterium]
MATRQPHLPTAPLQQEQLYLPLTKTQTAQSISTQEVWLTLNAQQQAQLFRQMVQICCSLLTTSHPKEVDDETR